MKIFLPFKKELNPYLEEIIAFSDNSFNYSSYDEYDGSYDIVNIHWPEALFQWKEPTESELKTLEEQMILWKKGSLLVYTKHDYQRNKGTTVNFSKLFELVEKYTDVFIHLGQFSKDLYSRRYPKAIHEIVNHPLYKNHFEIHDKIKARKQLGINENATVIIVPGTIRTYQERDLILNAFKDLKLPGKVLICTNVHSEIRFDFPGRVKLKRVFDVKNYLVDKFRSKHQPPKYLFTYGMVPRKELELKMSAADLVIIPRINTLNSGLVFLGLTYDKITVGPACGNIREQIIELGYPLFDPKSISSLKKAIYKGLEMKNEGKQSHPEILKKYESENVAREMDRVFKNILNR
ncbi:glycosyltransferase involved in cell wall biosynthesis [Gramella sp. Hel_I_59]|uniref:hypothetical protein n=1 Tax=Gramella sp. Hel_I_59 TaxID=1249978 RepID=UPI00114EC2AF|nr:hypothetical protein [Gramella sp. Hel_I_59]TQI71541.1 glycosyltransferase involved in cell wall biosynthesis [Gramella sp. Hel_I_59]